MKQQIELILKFLEKIPVKIIVFIVFMVSACLIIFNQINPKVIKKIPIEFIWVSLMIGLFYFVFTYLITIEKKREIKGKLKNLDELEKTVFSFFIKNNQNTIEMMVNNATIAGLINKGLLEKPYFLNNFNKGFCFPLSIPILVKKHLKLKYYKLNDSDYSENIKKLKLTLHYDEEY